jgi:hypothetical protein
MKFKRKVKMVKIKLAHKRRKKKRKKKATGVYTLETGDIILV